MLHTIGIWNNHRLKYGDIVNSRKRYICLMEASEYPVVARDVISFEQADRFFNQALNATFPDCRMQIYKATQTFHSIDPHVAFYGSDMNSVRDCRAKMLEWLKEESGDNAQEAIDTTNTTYDTYNESSYHKEIDYHDDYTCNTNRRDFDRQSRHAFGTGRKRTNSRNSSRRNSDRDLDTTNTMPQGKRRHSNSDERSGRARCRDKYYGHKIQDDNSLSSNSRVSDAMEGHLMESRSRDYDTGKNRSETTIEQRKEQPQSGQSAGDDNKLSKAAEAKAEATLGSQSEHAQNQKKKTLFDDESSDEEPIPGEYDGPDEF